MKKLNELTEENNKLNQSLKEKNQKIENEFKQLERLIKDFRGHVSYIIEGKEIAPEEEMMPCPRCGTMISKDAIVCYNCGFELGQK